jgi:UDP-glucose 4-epimerase
MKQHKKLRIFVTGAMGFIGEHWCIKLLKEGHIVCGLDLKKKNSIFNKYKNFKYYKDSVFNYQLIKKLVSKNEVICHFAGIANPKDYILQPSRVIEVTATASIKILEMVKNTNKKFIYTSTSEIYGKSLKIPFKETDDRLLGSTSTKRWCYSTSKALVEHYILALNEKNKLKYNIFRLFNVYGLGLKGRVVTDFINLAKQNKDLVIFGNGNQTRTFLYVDDCIEAFYRVLVNKKCENQIFNVGTNKETSIKEISKLILNLTKSKSKIRYKKISSFKIKGYEDIERRVPNNSKLKKFVKWSPKTNLKNGLLKII